MAGEPALGVAIEPGVEGVLDVEGWAELRREHFVRGVSIKELARRTGMSRNTIRAALRSTTPPRYERAPVGSKLDPFKPEIHRLLKRDVTLTAQRIRELIAPLGFVGGKTIVDDYVREVRPLFLPLRTYQRTIYRPGEICQFDLWEPAREIAVGHGQTRRGWVVIACLGYSRAGAGTLIFSKEIPDLLFGIRRCLWRLGALPQTLVWDRQAGLHAGGGRPTEAFASFCGQFGVGWVILDAGDAQAKGLLERSHRFMRTNFEPGRRFANPLDFQLQFDGWCEKVNQRVHRSVRAVPIERLIQEQDRMRPLPDPMPDCDRRMVVRVPQQPFLRVDRNDYSIDPAFAGRRVEVRVSQRQVTAVVLDSGELACQHRRCFAGGLTLVDSAHQTELEYQRARRRQRHEVEVEIRPLARYDALIPA
jgi:transposase